MSELETETIDLSNTAASDGEDPLLEPEDELEAMRRRIAEMEEEARNLESMADPSGTGAPVATGPEADLRSAYVGNVDYSTKLEELQKLFSSCGKLERVTIMCDKWSGHPKGFAYIQFANQEGLENAVLLDGSEFKGRLLKVSPKRTNIPGFNRHRRRRRRRRSSWRRRSYYSYRPRYYQNKKAVYTPY